MVMGEGGTRILASVIATGANDFSHNSFNYKIMQSMAVISRQELRIKHFYIK